MLIVFFIAIALFLPDILDMTDEDQSLEVRAAAAERILSFHSRVWPTVITLVCLIGIHSIRIFHRLFGALYRFRWIFQKISKGDLSCRVKLRKRDYLHQEKVLFNEMMDVFTEKWGSMQIAVQDALKSLNVLEQAAKEKSGWRDTDQKLIQKPIQDLKALADHAQYFRLREGEEPEEY